ncbi:MAG: L-serine ammonia-lyase [Candidatus Nanopelagicales bacterium]
MALSVLDLFKIGVGPSSSHTVGPMIAARQFVMNLDKMKLLTSVTRLEVQLFGSLGATGHGHGSESAVLAGLIGYHPETVDTNLLKTLVSDIKSAGTISLLDKYRINFTFDEDLILHRRKSLPSHPNGMYFDAYQEGELLLHNVFYSVGGGFVVDESAIDEDKIVLDERKLKYPFRTAAELLEHATTSGLPISDIMFANELSWRSEAETRQALLYIWDVMSGCIDKGCATEGILPGSLKVRRRAYDLHQSLLRNEIDDPMNIMDWVNLFALAVNEENADGGRIVTAPTNGAAGIIPAVLRYYKEFVKDASDDGVVRFLLTAGAIGIVYKETASISGAEVGCQGEVGSACSMAAAGLAEVLGATPEQVENAAEIAMEHNLGLTCDPVGGLVQIPCIERNAIAAVKAINAARMAMRGDGKHVVSLDKVIKTMRETGADMKVIYKETARGGLAVNVIEC